MGRLARNVRAVARREYIARVRSRSFVVLTIMLAVAAIGFGLLPVVFRAVLSGADATVSIGVASADDALEAEQIAATIDAQLELVGRVEAGDATARYDVRHFADLADARDRVAEGRLEGVLIVSRADDGDLAFDFYSGASPRGSTVALVRAAAATVALQDRLERTGIDPAEAESLFEPPAFALTAPGELPQADEPPDAAAARYLIATALVVVLFLAIITYGQWVASSVVEEKSSRVMELLVSAATSNELLAGKVIGAGAAGITQYAAILLPGVAAFALQDRLGDALFGAGPSVEGFSVTVPMLLVFGVFFVLGFALYALLYAAAGSPVSRQEDVQQISAPMITLATLGYFASVTASGDLGADWVSALSLVPFFSPYLIVMRAVVGQVTPTEVAAAAAILVVTLLVVGWFAARVYSAGVLMYGQRAGLTTFARAFRTRR